MARKPKVSQPEPAYRTAYADNGSLVCPECGQDLAEWEAASVAAHSLDHYPEVVKDGLSEEAEARRDVLASIAKGKR